MCVCDLEFSERNSIGRGYMRITSFEESRF